MNDLPPCPEGIDPDLWKAAHGITVDPMRLIAVLDNLKTRYTRVAIFAVIGWCATAVLAVMLLTR